MTAPSRSRPRRLVRRLLALLVGSLVALVLVELGVRWLLFSDSALAARAGKRLRHAECVADAGTDEYWKLQWVFDRAQLVPARPADPEIGWLGPAAPGTYAHPDEAKLAGRRPLLLFGDSYAQCNTEPGECFQALLEDSDLAREFGLLNYGVGGYGVDQELLLLRRVLPRFAAARPFVVVGVMLDDDFNRSLLGVRCWPKSRAHLVDGALRIEPAGETDPEALLRVDPPRAWSWLARLFVYRDGLLPQAWQRPWRDEGAPVAERVAVNRALLEAIAAELDTAGVEHVFLFFSGEQTLFDDPAYAWTMRLAREFQRETQQPCVYSAPYLLAGACGERERARLFFGTSGQLAGHYNAWGNRIAFEALRQGVLHGGAPPDVTRVEQMCASGALQDLGAETRELELLGRRARLSTHTRASSLRYRRPAPGEARGDLWLRAGAGGPTTLELELDGGTRRFAASAERPLEDPATCSEGALRLSLDVDGRNALVWTSPGAPAGSRDSATRALELPLENARRLRITLGLAGAREECGWIVLRGVLLE